MCEHFRRKKWDELRELSDKNAVLKVASYELGTKELAFTMAKLQPGQGVSHHKHGKGSLEEGAEEVYFLMEGKSQVLVNDEKFDAEAIEIFYFSPETMRSVYNNSDKPSTWIFLAPMREGFNEAYSRVEEK